MVDWIRIADIPQSDLPGDQKIALVAMALEEAAIAQALKMIHGDRWEDVYVSVGGHVRMDEQGEPVVPRNYGRK